MLNDKKINNTLILTIFFNIIIFDFSYFKKYLGAGLQVKKKGKQTHWECFKW